MDPERYANMATERLLLRPPYEADPDDLVARLNDWAVTRWLSRVPFPYTRADAVEMQVQLRAEFQPSWSIFDERGLVGGIGLVGHLGFWIAQDAWGQGYATEAARAVLNAHFNDLDAGAVSASYFVGNAVSARVLDKLGFLKVGTCRLMSLSRGCEVDAVGMLLTRSDWHISPASAGLEP